MTILKKLAKEVTKCRNLGDLRGRGYPVSLRKKVNSAVSQYGLSKVSKAIGIHRSVIGKWGLEKNILKPRPSKSLEKMDRPVIFQELPLKNKHSNLNDLARPTPEGTFLRLTSPTGFTIDLSGNPDLEITSSIIRTFMGGLS